MNHKKHAEKVWAEANSAYDKAFGEGTLRQFKLSEDAAISIIAAALEKQRVASGGKLREWLHISGHFDEEEAVQIVENAEVEE